MNNISNIIYDGTKLSYSDFEGIKDKFNNIYYDLYDISVTGKPLTIYTDEYTYNFEILTNYIVYIDDNHRYFTKADNIDIYFSNLISKYNIDDFFTIDVINNYDFTNSDYFIKLDNSNKYIILKTELNIYDFKIINNDYVSYDESYLKQIDSNKIMCIETSNIDNIVISFSSPYNYNYNISYDKEFIIDINKNISNSYNY